MTDSTVQELRDFLNEGRERLLRRAPATGSGRAWARDYTALIDETLGRIYSAAWATARAALGEAHTHPEREAELVLLAVGGYGRGELCPYSDIDLVFVPAEEEHPVIDAVAKEAFRMIVEVLIDGARLTVSYAYRPISDCDRLDHTGRTALLEARRIAGCERLLWQLHEELYRTWDAVELLLSQAAERREVAQQIPLSVYAIEPHLKEGAGALRDIQSALWVAGAMLKTTAPLRELEWRGVVTAEDCAQAIAAQDFFLSLRVWLHLTAGKKVDVLRIEWQDRCAHAFGYTGGGALAAQRLLADYYRHAEVSARFSGKVMRRLLEDPLPLDGHFVATNRRVTAAHPYTLRNHPELLLAPFALAHKYGFLIAPELDRAVEEALPLMNAETRCHVIARAGFFSLLLDVGAAGDALTELRARGVLQQFMPEFGKMLHLAPSDPTHQLTVGEHSIFAVRQLGLSWNKRRDDDELYAVWEGVDDTSLLVLATLLHDVGKIDPTGDHAAIGAEMAMRIGERLNLSSERNERLALLVRRHLLLPRVARLRDLSAPGTIREVMEQVRDVATLKMLYLLSLADTRAVDERAYSNLDLQAMRELYQRVLNAMTREEAAEVLTDTEKREQMVQRERERLRREMRHLELDDATLLRLCNDLPTAYVLNTPLPTVATHLRFLDQLPKEKMIVDFYPDPSDAFTEMTVVTYDDPRPGLLSKICGVVQAAGAQILAAQVYTLPHHSPGLAARDGEESERQTAMQATEPTSPQSSDTRDIVLDRLHVTYNDRPLSEPRGARLAAWLREVLLGHKSIEAVLQATGKETTLGLTPQRIAARNDLSDEHTVLNIVSDNVPGLLYSITRALAAIELDIHTAKITTWGGRAEDAFYVTRRSADGHSEKIDDDSIRSTLEALRKKLQKPS